MGRGQNEVLTGALQGRGASDLREPETRTGPDWTMGRRGSKRGGDPESPTDETCPQGAYEHGRDHWKQGRWDPSRNRRKVLLDGCQLQVRCWSVQD